MTEKQSITAFEFANQLADRVQGCYTPSTGNLKGSVWTKKGGEVRVYLKTWKNADCGFVSITSHGTVSNRGKSYVQEVVDEQIDRLLEEYEVSSTIETSASPPKESVEMCWNCHYNVAAFKNGLCVSCVD